MKKEQNLNKAETQQLNIVDVSNRTYKGWLTVDKDGTECWHEDEPEKEIVYWGRYRDWETDRKSTRLNSSHSAKSRMPSSA